MQLRLKPRFALVQPAEGVDLVLILAPDLSVLAGGRGFVLSRELEGGWRRR